MKRVITAATDTNISDDMLCDALAEFAKEAFKDNKNEPAFKSVLQTLNSYASDMYSHISDPRQRAECCAQDLASGSIQGLEDGLSVLLDPANYFRK